MKYENNKIVYEVEDWTTQHEYNWMDSTVQIAGIKENEIWTWHNRDHNNKSYLPKKRFAEVHTPATQEEIDKATKEEIKPREFWIAKHKETLKDHTRFSMQAHEEYPEGCTYCTPEIIKVREVIDEQKD